MIFNIKYDLIIKNIFLFRYSNSVYTLKAFSNIKSMLKILVKLKNTFVSFEQKTSHFMKDSY